MDLNSMQLHTASYAPVPSPYHQSFALLQKSIFAFLMFSFYSHNFACCFLTLVLTLLAPVSSLKLLEGSLGPERRVVQYGSYT